MTNRDITSGNIISESSSRIPMVSFVMPAYNSASLLPQAVDSIIAQTFEDWELIIVDDASTDETGVIADDYAARDGRIRAIHRKEQSGSVFRPRRDAIYAAQSNIISPLDADDRIPPEYLANLFNEREKYGADAVYPLMYEWKGAYCHPLIDPDGEHFYSPCEGRKMVKFSLDGWSITCNGGLIDKDIYLKAFSLFGDHHTYSHADEAMTRQILLLCKCVVFTKEKYYYRSNPESITRKYNPSRFDVLHSYAVLIDLMEKNYSRDSEEYMLAHRQLLSCSSYFVQLVNNEFPASARSFGKKKIADAIKLIDFNLLKPYVRPRQWIMMQLPLAFVFPLMWIKDNLKALPANAKKMAKRFLKPILGSLVRNVKKIVASRKELKKHRDELQSLLDGKLLSGSESDLYFRKYYAGAGNLKNRPQKNAPKTIICPFDGTVEHGGLTDRLRGILSVYAQAKKEDIPFKIAWDYPFKLETYLAPATFDWRIGRDAVIRNAEEATPLIIQDLDGQVGRLMLSNAISSMPGTLHIYSNSNDCAGHYQKLYRELFRPTPLLQKAFDYHRQEIGIDNRYWAFTFRFTTLLGDFDDSVGSILEPPAAESLMQQSLDTMLQIMGNMPEGYRALVTSDSKLFLDFINGKDKRLYIVAGEIENVDRTNKHDTDAWLKMFVDQHLIMDAERVYRMTGPGMYPTGFPKFAAEVGGRKFIDFEFK